MNNSKKDYHEPMHTCEHILNQTMVQMFDCERSKNAHIERKKSKCDYFLSAMPTEKQVEELVKRVNEIIRRHLPVTIDFLNKEEAAKIVDLSKLPSDTNDTLRIVRVGDYDTCACIGRHVENTSEIGTFTIISHDFANEQWRVRFKLV
jgi:Ser-tRNA(Ala) deacylase AlaX